MRTYTMADLGNTPKRVCDELQPVLITSNGKPKNIVINVSDMPIDESISLAQEIYGQYCIRKMRSMSRESGLSSMTESEIETEIGAVRSNR